MKQLKELNLVASYVLLLMRVDGMNNEKYEPIKFETWQELAKYVIDGGEVYWFGKNNVPNLVEFNGVSFHADIPLLFKNVDGGLYTKKQPTLKELIAIRPRLCWVWDEHVKDKRLRLIYRYQNGQFYIKGEIGWCNAQMLTDDEIKQFLSDGE